MIDSQARQAIWKIRLVFFLEASILTSFFPRFPEFMDRLSLDEFEFGLALLGLPLGTLLALIFVGRFVERAGTKKASLIGISLVTIFAWLPPLASSFLPLILSLFAMGGALAFIEIGMNVEADRVERWTKRSIMSSCHGCWSLGALAGTGYGAICLFFQISPFQQVFFIGSVLGILAVVTILSRVDAPNVSSTEAAPAFALPTKALLGLCFFAVGLQMAEGAALDWAGVYMRDVLNSGSFLIGAAYFAFTLSMAATRFAGDGLCEKFGPVRLAQVTTILACLGLTLLGLDVSATVAILGWALIGVGTALAFPLAVTAAAARTDRPASVNVASVFLVSFSAFLVGPPLIGSIAKLWGFQTALLALVPFCILGFMLAKHVATEPKDIN